MGAKPGFPAQSTGDPCAKSAVLGRASHQCLRNGVRNSTAGCQSHLHTGWEHSMHISQGLVQASQRAQKTGMLQCGEPREHQDCWQKDESWEQLELRSKKALPANQYQMLGWQKNETKCEGSQIKWAVLNEEPEVPIADGNGSGDKTMPALAQATERCWKPFLQVP